MRGIKDSSRSLVGENAEDVAALAVAVVWSLLGGGPLRGASWRSLALPILAVAVVPARRHARHGSRRRAILLLRAIAQPLGHVRALPAGRAARRATSRRGRACAAQALVVNPVIRAAQGVLA